MYRSLKKVERRIKRKKNLNKRVKAVRPYVFKGAFLLLFIYLIFDIIRGCVAS